VSTEPSRQKTITDRLGEGCIGFCLLVPGLALIPVGVVVLAEEGGALLPRPGLVILPQPRTDALEAVCEGGRPVYVVDERGADVFKRLPLEAHREGLPFPYGEKRQWVRVRRFRPRLSSTTAKASASEAKGCTRTVRPGRQHVFVLVRLTSSGAAWGRVAGVAGC